MWKDILKEVRKEEGSWAVIANHLKAKLQEYKQDYPQANTLSFNPYSEIWKDLKWALSQPNGQARLSDLGSAIGFNSFNAAHQGDSEKMAFYY